MTKNGPCGQGLTLWGQDQSPEKMGKSLKISVWGEPNCVQARLGLILTNKLEGSRRGDSQIKFGNRALSMPLENSLPNTIGHLEQVLREFSEGVMIP